MKLATAILALAAAPSLANEIETQDKSGYLRSQAETSSSSSSSPVGLENAAKYAALARARRMATAFSDKANRNKAKATSAAYLESQGFDGAFGSDAVHIKGGGKIVVHAHQKVNGLHVRGTEVVIVTDSAGGKVVKEKGVGKKGMKGVKGQARKYNKNRDLSVAGALRKFKGEQNVVDCKPVEVKGGGWDDGWTECGGYKLRLAYSVNCGESSVNAKKSNNGAKKSNNGMKEDKVRLVWEIHDVETSTTAYHAWLDAKTGEVCELDNWVRGQAEEYEALPLGVTDPIDGNFILNSAGDASWHFDGTNTFSYTRGNNVCAYSDEGQTNPTSCADAITKIPGSFESPSLGTTYNTAYDPTKQPQDVVNKRAATINLFYWNNIIHDFLYLYGFDETSGNFQVDNGDIGGAGGDPVRAESQDGSGTNNANMATPPDGSPPRMQMYRTTCVNPGRDTSLDNMVVAHEYGHGLSNRLTGGPSNSGCLSNAQQAGEGWSDLLGLFMTDKDSYTGLTERAVGTWSFCNPGGIRNAPYTTDMNVNPYTYSDIDSVSRPHGVGFVWASIYWEVFWNLRNAVGFNADLTGATGLGGNTLAVQLFIDGLKIQSCSPSFVNARDAILEAYAAIEDDADTPTEYKGHKCLIWEGFAKRGLGDGAVSSPTVLTVEDSFIMPSECIFGPAISCAPSSFSVNQADSKAGTTLTSTCTVTSSVEYEGDVNLSCQGVSGVSCTSISPSSLFVSSSSSNSVTVVMAVGSNQPTSESFDIAVNVVDSLNPTLNDADTIAVAVIGPEQATYDGGMGAPVCETVRIRCDTGELVDGRGSVGPEPNQPNTLNGCSDGNSGSYHNDESLDRLEVKTIDGTALAEGKEVEIKATVWCWSDGASDEAHFYHASDANSSPSWIFIGSVQCPGGGAQELTQTYTIPEGANLQAVRVSFTYNGNAASCPTGNYDDADDLVFAVGPFESLPTMSPTDSPSKAPTTSTTTTTTTSAAPTSDPTSPPTDSPSKAPTTTTSTTTTTTTSAAPTSDPTSSPTDSPSKAPTTSTTTTTTTTSAAPTSDPTSDPTNDPTSDPTSSPTDSPSKAPTTSTTTTTTTTSAAPTSDPSSDPTSSPTDSPSKAPTTSSTTTTSTTAVTTTTTTSAAPTGSPTESPSKAPTCASFSLVLTTDDYPAETTWDLTNVDTGTVVLSGDGNGNTAGTTITYSAELCDLATYEFTMRDQWGDGICCDYGTGSYSIYLDDVEISTEESGEGNFGGIATTPFDVRDGPITEGCGDGICENDESCGLCPSDCGECALPNLALDKSATQSSTLPASQVNVNYGGDAFRANDGNTDGDWYGASVSHTNTPDECNWWMVDLGADVDVGLVKVYNRRDCCANRLFDFAVEVLAADGTTVVSSVYHDGEANVLTRAGFPVGTAGRYVRIQNVCGQYLQLAEVEVFANSDGTTAFAAAAKPATSSDKVVYVGSKLPPKPSTKAIVANYLIEPEDVTPLKPKNARCTLSSQCLSGNCHGNRKCK